MNPETITKLTSDIPEMQEFIEFVRSKVAELNTIAELETIPRTEREVVIEGRFWAIKKLAEILSPLINIPTQRAPGTNAQDYVV